jgi:hypothetical protein
MRPQSRIRTDVVGHYDESRSYAWALFVSCPGEMGARRDSGFAGPRAVGVVDGHRRLNRLAF